MWRSLSSKLIIAFLFTALCSIALVGWVTHRVIDREFSRLVAGQALEDFTASALSYYSYAQSWEGFDVFIHNSPRAFAPPPFPMPLNNPALNRPVAPNERNNRNNNLNNNMPPPPPLDFMVIDGNGIAQNATNLYALNSVVPSELSKQGQALIYEGETVASIVTLSNPRLEQQEQAFLSRINNVLLYSSVGAGVLALFMAAMFALTLTRPLRALQRATQGITQGQLKQHVAIASQDEIGQLAQHFNEMSDALSQANHLREQMTADIAHELRTPLSVISGYLEAMRDGVLKATPERLESLYSEAQHLQHLVEDLRTLSLADAGQLRLEPQPCKPCELLQSVLARYEDVAKQAHISLLLDCPSALEAISLDAHRIKQVLSNLLSNALRYTPAEGNITLSASQDAKKTTFSVKDNGKGIASEQLNDIFERFYRVESSRETLKNNLPEDVSAQSGLGLAIAKSIVLMHNGNIKAISQVGEGTEIIVELPNS